MVVKLRFISMILILFFCTMDCVNAQTYKQKARSNLQKWGIAYCMSKTSTVSIIDTLSGNAQSAYFELGSHTDKAYQEIKKFVDEYTKIQYQGKEYHDLSIQKCLDLIDSKTYKKKVKYCDNYLIK